MISEDWIIKTAVKLQTSEVNVRREYFQHLILSSVYRQRDGEKLLFKGGTALRFVFNSPRFSEDLDFEAFSLSPKQIEDIILDAGEEMTKENLGFEIAEAVKTAEGYIAKLTFSTPKGPLIIKTDFSLRKNLDKGLVKNLENIYILPYQLVTLEKEKLIEGKLAAFFNREKPRDYYDLYFAIRANLIPVKLRPILAKALPIITKTKINFEKELKVFLPQTHWLIISTLKKSLIEEIQMMLARKE